jgi:hypothetical protein
MTIPRRYSAVALATLLAACGGGTGPGAVATESVSPAEVHALLSQLADDSMAGRRVGEPGALRAAMLIEREMRRLGLEPAGDSGFYQRVPMFWGVRPDGQRRRMLATGFDALDSIPLERRIWAANLVGRMPGSDPSLAGEHILIDAHYDHVGIGPVVAGDSVYNGADDDASGVVATLKTAEILARGPRPRRTIYFAAMTAEESGLLGARWFVDHPPRPLVEMVANLEIEMIGRPDSLAGGFGKAWLTGYERSTMGDLLAAQGIPLVPDPRPTQNFFQRSDNYQLALRGVVAHTLSSFNLHADYHRPSDETEKVDAAHMTEVIRATARATRLLADGVKPEWKPGGKPERVAR